MGISLIYKNITAAINEILAAACKSDESFINRQRMLIKKLAQKKKTFRVYHLNKSIEIEKQH
jgi:hypothetical protein